MVIEEAVDEVFQSFYPARIDGIDSVRLVNCLHPIAVNGGVFACGKCLLCRINQRNDWSLRLDLEASGYIDNSFATLTYDPDCVPLELEKRDLQLFFKRFRKSLGYKVRFFASGEYGDRFTERPHFHFVCFGHSPDDYDKVGDSWPNGFVKVDFLSDKRTKYVAGYVQKKLGFFNSDSEGLPDDFYDWSFAERARYVIDMNLNCDYRKRPFATMSRMPGIGFDWFMSHRDFLRDRFSISVNGRLRPIPRYFRKLMAEYDPAWQDLFIANCQMNLYQRFEDFKRRYGCSDVLAFYDQELSKVRHRAEEFRKRHELYLAEKKKRSNCL